MACTGGEGAREAGRNGEGENEGERARTPRAAVTAGTTSAMRQSRGGLMSLSRARRPVVAPGTIRRLANAGGNRGGGGVGGKGGRY